MIVSQQSRLTVFGAVASVTALFYLEASMDNHCYSPLSYRVKGWNSDEIESEDYFRILSQYYDELKHRDNLFWKQIFTYFYAVIIVCICPLTKPLELNIPCYIPKIIFPIVGLIMTIFFLFVSLAYSKRLECIGDAYSNMLKMIPQRIRPKLIEQVGRFKPFRWRMTKVISWVMFLLLFFLNSLMLIVELSESIYRGGLT